ncbi:hypothetical protein CC2G_002232 [Coprinopsis cinerea AmutBmut pab1-1]|nr:hypothetical protein CC2G_002232 [Coprinopsis cinerea AmutBmut pab1-1]
MGPGSASEEVGPMAKDSNQLQRRPEKSSIFQWTQPTSERSRVHSERSTQPLSRPSPPREVSTMNGSPQDGQEGDMDAGLDSHDIARDTSLSGSKTVGRTCGSPMCLLRFRRTFYKLSNWKTLVLFPSPDHHRRVIFHGSAPPLWYLRLSKSLWYPGLVRINDTYGLGPLH